MWAAGKDVKIVQEGARVVEVILVEVSIATPGDNPDHLAKIRNVMEFWTKSGNLIARFDPAPEIVEFNRDDEKRPLNILSDIAKEKNLGQDT